MLILNLPQHLCYSVTGKTRHETLKLEPTETHRVSFKSLKTDSTTRDSCHISAQPSYFKFSVTPQPASVDHMREVTLMVHFPCFHSK